MKTYNNLFDQICDPANIEKAILKASLGKRHKKSVQRALRKRKEIAAYLSEQLKTGQWRPIELHSAKVINDGVELKKRLIICPAFVREQIVHHAIFNVCAPLFQRKFYRYSCGSVPERGAEFAKKYIEKKVRRSRAKTKYVCKLDVKKYFPTARPSVIFRELRRTIRDRRVLGGQTDQNRIGRRVRQAAVRRHQRNGNRLEALRRFVPPAKSQSRRRAGQVQDCGQRQVVKRCLTAERKRRGSTPAAFREHWRTPWKKKSN